MSYQYNKISILAVDDEPDITFTLMEGLEAKLYDLALINFKCLRCTATNYTIKRKR
jgi:hypothetical protein